MDQKSNTYAPRTRHWHKLLLCLGLVAALGMEECEVDLGFVSIDSPQAKTFTEAQTVTITATAVSGDGLTVVGIDFYRNGRKMGTDATPPYTHDWPITAADNDHGPHRWHAEAVYQVGSTGEERLKSDEVVYEVDIASSAGDGANLVGSLGGLGTIHDLALDENAGIAAAGTTEGLFLVNIQNPRAPVVFAQFPGQFGSVALGDSAVYAVRVNSPSDLELVSIRLQSDSASIASSIGLTGNLTSRRNGLALYGDRLYVAATRSGLHIFDVSKPLSPSLLAIATVNGHPTAVVADLNRAYVGALGVRTELDTRVPEAPVVVSEINARTAAIDVDHGRLYHLDEGSYVTSRPAGGGPAWLDDHKFAQEFAVGRYLTVSWWWFNRLGGVRIFDLRDLTKPELIQEIDSTERVQAIAMDGDLMMTGDDAGTVKLYSLD